MKRNRGVIKMTKINDKLKTAQLTGKLEKDNNCNYFICGNDKIFYLSDVFNMFINQEIKIKIEQLNKTV